MILSLAGPLQSAHLAHPDPVSVPVPVPEPLASAPVPEPVPETAAVPQPTAAPEATTTPETPTHDVEFVTPTPAAANPSKRPSRQLARSRNIGTPITSTQAGAVHCSQIALAAEPFIMAVR